MKILLRHLLVYCLTVTVLFTLARSFFTGENLIDQLRFYSFAPAAWKKASPDQRYYMANFLIDRNLLIGRTKTQVSEMLGGGDAGALFAYALGREHGSFLSINSDWLELRFDDNSDDAVVVSAVIRAQ
ncbi:hypothetical protein [Prosthecobacter sp.]|uniref:hypothetical protein n=1 Tax=Prosthecobacter sp. TaxID=1965333 RepID=UPI002AB8EA2B|nr:hypothetical protein [Prosthecobacter sp.]MDZ4403785.1 hypothetical protein [Prosthecobacter sp.]